mmetsp:Transcript_10096/g.11473  ORF Transcript_10096/g.11473 Transcript_10096/m.11473 type:complete len:85 (-) Transcript_10096:223-477(-)
MLKGWSVNISLVEANLTDIFNRKSRRQSIAKTIPPKAVASTSCTIIHVPSIDKKPIKNIPDWALRRIKTEESSQAYNGYAKYGI